MKKKTRQIERLQARHIDRLAAFDTNPKFPWRKKYSKEDRREILDENGKNYRLTEASSIVKSMGRGWKASLFRELHKNMLIGDRLFMFFHIRKIFVEKTIGEVCPSKPKKPKVTQWCPLGATVIASPDGPGVITGHSERGYPKVNHITVAWCLMRAEELYLFDPHGKYSDKEIPSEFFTPRCRHLRS
jgi:hypothetical protein